VLDLKPFCWRELKKPRYAGVVEPFCLGDGWRYAADGGICVRVPSKGRKTEAEVPRVGEAFQDFAAGLCLKSWPGRGVLMRETECPACGEPIGLALAPQVVAGRLISGFYWWLVSQLAEVRYNPNEKPAPELNSGRASFIAAGSRARPWMDNPAACRRSAFFPCVPAAGVRRTGCGK